MKKEKRVQKQGSAAALENQTQTSPATPPAAGNQAANKMGWSAYRDILEKDLAHYRNFGGSMRRAGLAETGIQRKGLLFTATRAEREAALIQRTLEAENFEEAAGEYLRFFDNNRRLRELRNAYGTLEESLLDGLSPAAVELWYKARDKSCREFVRRLKAKPTAKGGAK